MPLRKRPMMNASFPDLRGEHRTESVPPVPNRLVADIDAPLEQEILDLSQRQRIADIHHHREADHLRRAVEITEGILHCRRLRNLTRRLKPIYSDNAHCAVRTESARCSPHRSPSIHRQRWGPTTSFGLTWLARDRAADGAGSSPMVTWELRR